MGSLAEYRNLYAYRIMRMNVVANCVHTAMTRAEPDRLLGQLKRTQFLQGKGLNIEVYDQRLHEMTLAKDF